MKRKKAGSSATTDLRSFLQKSAAKKKQLHPDIVIPSTNESQMQLVVFQGQSDIGTSTVPPQPVKDEQRQSGEPPKTEDDESMPPAQSDSSSSDSDEDNNDDYEIEHDPGLRIPISSYPVNARASVRRALIVMGPCRPKMKREDFPQHKCGGMCRFNLKWFDEFKWIEYSVHRDAAYCFICYLFKDSGDVGGDAFVDGGFRNWHMKARIRKHVGAIDSYHNEAEEKYNRFIMPKTSIRESIASNSEQIKERYRARLTWSLKCIRKWHGPFNLFPQVKVIGLSISEHWKKREPKRFSVERTRIPQDSSLIVLQSARIWEMMQACTGQNNLEGSKC